jgi:hypothetical protein
MKHPIANLAFERARDAVEVLHARPLQRQDKVVRSCCSIRPPATRRTGGSITPQRRGVHEQRGVYLHGVVLECALRGGG